MIRGTTPTHVFRLPVSADTVKAVRIVYAQNNAVKLQKCNEDCTMEGNTVTCKLSQEDTFLFADGECILVQVRVLTNEGEALASRVMRVHCEECLSDEVLT